MQEHHSCWHKLRLGLLEGDKTTWSLVIHDFATNTLYWDPGSIKNTFVQKKSSEQGLQQIPLLCFFPIPHFASIASVRRMSTLCPAICLTRQNYYISSSWLTDRLDRHGWCWRKSPSGFQLWDLDVYRKVFCCSIRNFNYWQILATLIFGHFSPTFVIMVYPGQYSASPGTNRAYYRRKKHVLASLFVWKLWRLLNWNLKAYLNFIKIFGASLWPSAVSICQTIIH